jgi:hypothetical protein
MLANPPPAATILDDCHRYSSPESNEFSSMEVAEQATTS